MRDRDDDNRLVFWCDLLGDLLRGEVPEAERGAHLRQLAAEERRLPDGSRGRVSLSTLRRRLRAFERLGVAGLRRKPRDDRGRPRRRRDGTLARAVELKREQPLRSATTINLVLRAERGDDIPRSTLYRHLRREGATRRKLGVVRQPVRRRWTRERRADGDLHRPSAADGGGGSAAVRRLGEDRDPRAVRGAAAADQPPGDGLPDRGGGAAGAADRRLDLRPGVGRAAVDLATFLIRPARARRPA